MPKFSSVRRVRDRFDFFLLLSLSSSTNDCGSCSKMIFNRAWFSGLNTWATDLIDSNQIFGSSTAGSLSPRAMAIDLFLNSFSGMMPIFRVCPFIPFSRLPQKVTHIRHSKNQLTAFPRFQTDTRKPQAACAGGPMLRIGAKTFAFWFSQHVRCHNPRDGACCDHAA